MLSDSEVPEIEFSLVKAAFTKRDDEERSPGRPIAVSYTHLDVYKRQLPTPNSISKASQPINALSALYD